MAAITDITADNPALAAQAAILARPVTIERQMADAVRMLAVDAVEAAKSGHPGMPMGMADVATTLWTRFHKFDAADPRWPDRDRFVLSAGHGSMLLYALLNLTGHAGMEIEQLRRFRQLHAHTAGHPEYGEHPAIETTTGPLGQGIATAVGMALAERMLAARFGKSLVDHRTWVIAGDGCLMEGISQEAITLAGHLKLEKLTVLWDDNSISIDGPTSLSTSEDQLRRFAAAGWAVKRIDGHDPAQIAAALSMAVRSKKPTLIACKTIIGFAAPTKAGTAAVHGAPLGTSEADATRQALGWTHPPFEVPEALRARWQQAGSRGATARRGWLKRLARHPQRAEFERVIAGRLPETFHEAMAALKAQLAESKPKLATRAANQKVLEALVPAVPELVGGSADLTGSNLTLVRNMGAVAPGSYGGRYIHYGIREHGMAAAMNGIVLHGGLIPYGGTFFCFSDYMRPAIRLAALMRIRVVHVLTHDSIGLGEDGPTHQPVEHLASLRAMPNVYVMRPADALETAECWELALRRSEGPSLLVLSRQALPALRGDSAENRCARGGYILAEADGPRQATLIATGSEVSIAMAARDALAAEGIKVAVVSLPCWELFAAQDEAWRAEVLGGAPRFGIEAAAPFGWERWLGPDGCFIGMTGFGASAPADDLYRHFGITAETVAAAVRKRVS
ncbi:Transketolase [Rhodovastum atsumiense]|uniref:Transketolase n=1 Tax=Rhodovastum atsumiense TaxID=504468 RepID=A0A5M6IRR8_9PROT|nr:transketolase [Rhodovastum atsumiense]KAA5611000.1 transketolase [Rhodovastum atsumiense]CAH2600219.1 Transketolase [Rhodovastum atsumiense]